MVRYTFFVFMLTAFLFSCELAGLEKCGDDVELGEIEFDVSSAAYSSFPIEEKLTFKNDQNEEIVFFKVKDLIAPATAGETIIETCGNNHQRYEYYDYDAHFIEYESEDEDLILNYSFQIINAYFEPDQMPLVDVLFINGSFGSEALRIVTSERGGNLYALDSFENYIYHEDTVIMDREYINVYELPVENGDGMLYASSVGVFALVKDEIVWLLSR